MTSTAEPKVRTCDIPPSSHTEYALLGGAGEPVVDDRGAKSLKLARDRLSTYLGP